MAETKAQFPSLPIETQLSLYLVGMEVRHPPAIYLGECFALNGEKGMKVVIEAMRTARRGEEVYDLVVLARHLDVSGAHDVVSDHDFNSVARVAIDGIGDATWKDMAREEYARIGSDRLSKERASMLCIEGRR